MEKIKRNFNSILRIFFLVFVFSLFNLIVANANSYFAKVIIIGDYGSGKTFLFDYYLDKKISALRDHTKDFQGRKKFFEYGNHSIQLKLWDTAGQERYHGQVKSFFRSADIAFIVVDLEEKKEDGGENDKKKDICKPDGLDSRIKRWIKEVLEMSPNCQLILIGTKKDLLNPYRLSEVEFIMEREAGFAKCPWAIVSPVSEPNNVISEFDRCIVECLNKIISLGKLSSVSDEVNIIKINQPEETRSSGGCC